MHPHHLLPCRLFLLVWAFQVGALLVAPRLLARRVLPRIAANPLLQCRSPDQHQLPSTPKGAVGGAAAAVSAVVQAGLSYLLWPVAALFFSASVTGGEPSCCGAAGRLGPR